MKYALAQQKTDKHYGTDKEKATSFDVDHVDELIVKRKGGGSIVSLRPLFSDDSSSIYILWENTIREYNTKTGQLLKTFENPSTETVDCITDLGVNSTEKSLIYACSSNGKLLSWNKESGFLHNVTDFKKKVGGNKVVGFHFSMYKNQLYLITNRGKKYGLWRTNNENDKQCLELPFKCQEGKHTYSFGGESQQEFVARINTSTLWVLDLKTGNDNKIIGHAKRPFTCVVSHKTEMCIATGDSSGRVLIWRDFFTKYPPYSVYHWHTLPVSDIAFTQAASHFYSGAAECVLVKWVMDTDSRVFLPRMGAPIVHVTVSPDNRYTAVSTEENAIYLVDPRTKIVQTIQHMSLSLPLGSDHHMFKAGLTLDPATKALIINCVSGYVQFYSVENRDLMFKLDIVGQNFITRERNSELVNTDITRVAITEDGRWLATVEERNDKETHMEVRLKFWKAHWLESFKLNTSVELPHQGEVVSLQFQPGVSDDEFPRAVTSGTDKRFCSWTLLEVQSENVANEDMSWVCESVGTHQNLQAGPAVFSSDGSLMAVAFEHAITLWLPGANELQSSLTHPETKEKIKSLQFGNSDCSHLLVSSSENLLCVWDLLTLTLAWTVPIHITCMTANPRTSHIAVFTKEQLLIFKPSKEIPLFKHKLPGDCQAVAATFYPYYGQKSQCIEWQQLAQLYFINKNQELLCFEKSCEDENVSEEVVDDMLPPTGQYHQTPFSALLAKQATSLVKEARPPPVWEQQLKSNEGSYTQMLCGTPAHMLPPMELIARDLIRECLEVQCCNSTDTTPNIKTYVEDMDEDTSGESESDSDVEEVEEKSKEKPKIKEEKIDIDVVAQEDKSRALEDIMKEDMTWVPNLARKSNK